MVEINLPPGVTAEDFQKAVDAMTKQAKKKVPEEAPVVFKEWESGGNLKRVYRGTYKGKEQLSVRAFYQDPDNPEWKFGKGVTFGFEDIDFIIEGLQAMKAWCEENSSEGAGQNFEPDSNSET
jgi:DNA-binding PadR family transcriptional regulator